MNKKQRVYALKCPITNEIKYIGITQRPLKVRLYDHLHGFTSVKLYEWFAKLLNRKCIPEIILLEEFDYNGTNSKEIYYINKYKNGNNLLNKKCTIENIKFYEPKLSKEKMKENYKKIEKRLLNLEKNQEKMNNLLLKIEDFLENM